MQDELPKLIKLQEFDSVYDDLIKKSQAMVPQIAKKNQELESLKSSMKSLKEKTASLQLKKKDLEAQVEEKEKLLKKHQAELNSLKSNDAYKAMLGEIGTTKTALTSIEDDILVVMESMEVVEKESREAEQKLKTQEGVIKSQIQQLEQAKASLDDQARKKQEERNTFATHLLAGTVAQYEKLRKRGGGVAIVPLLNNSCGGCRINLTPNKLIEIKKAKEVVICDNCSRIIYQPPTDAPAPIVVLPPAPASQATPSPAQTEPTLNP